MDPKLFVQLLCRILDKKDSLNRVGLKKLLDKIPTIDTLDNLAEGTVVLVRADVDVPLKDGIVVDMSRIEACEKTIIYCQQRKWKTIVFGHLGRDRNNTLAPVCKQMNGRFGWKFEFIPNWLDETKSRLVDSFIQRVAAAEPGSQFLLENTRKYSIEQALWKENGKRVPAISSKLYTLCQDFRDRLTTIEINDAIGASNIDFSSSVLPFLMSRTVMGFDLAGEMRNHMERVRRSNLVVFSGLKIDKLDDLEGIIDRGKLDLIIAAGSLAMALRKAQAQIRGEVFSIGLAETDPKLKAYIGAERIEEAKRIIKKTERLGAKIVLPVDYVLDDGSLSETIPNNRTQMDIGPVSIRLFADTINTYIEMSKSAKKPFVMYFNGAFGKFEDPRFERGTKSFIPLLKKMTDAGIKTYVGGGEGRLALLEYGQLEDVTHAFTCGGSVLKSLTNNHIAFLKAMYLQDHNYWTLNSDSLSEE